MNAFYESSFGAAAQDESCVAGHLGERAARPAADEDNAGAAQPQQEQPGEDDAAGAISAASPGQNGSTAANGHIEETGAAAGSAEAAGEGDGESSSIGEEEDESSSSEADAQEEQPAAHGRCCLQYGASMPSHAVLAAQLSCCGGGDNSQC